MPDRSGPGLAGPVLFARYAYPPNSHGYCGPGDHASFFEQWAAGDERGLRAMSAQFTGAWPYLELIAGALGIRDPLDPRVVTAYWIGSPELDRISTRAIGDSVESRFRFRAGPAFGSLVENVLAGGVPHHSFAVFCIYPWTGLLDDGRKASHALNVLDQCRIRWGQVVSVDGDQVLVESSPLTWDGKALGLGPLRTEVVTRAVSGPTTTTACEPGDWVAMHWEWMCDRLTEGQVHHLRRFTERHLKIVNDDKLGRDPASLLG